MKMRWVTKFNLGIKQVLIRQSGTALSWKKDQPQSKNSPKSTRRVRTQIKSDTIERAGSSEEERTGFSVRTAPGGKE